MKATEVKPEWRCEALKKGTPREVKKVLKQS